MQRHMPPVADDARTGLVPGPMSISGQVIPMEFLVAVIASWPAWHSPNRVTLCPIREYATRPVRRLRKLINTSDITANTNQEYTPSSLWDAIILSIQNIPSDAVPGKTIPADLVSQKDPVLPIEHPVNILDDKGSRSDYAEDSVEFLVQKIDRFQRISPPALAVALARVAPYKQLCFGELLERLNVTLDNCSWFDVVSIGFAGDIPYVVRPDNLESCEH
jgi:hypothetical protein